MYIQKITIENIRSISYLEFELAPDECAGWHVILGDNGSGKTTFLQAVSLALIGNTQNVLITDWDRWGGYSNRWRIHLTINRDLHYDNDQVFPTDIPIGPSGIIKLDVFKFPTKKPSFVEPHGTLSLKARGAGWFSVAYGPSRRFAGRNQEYDQIYKVYPKLAAHLSIFRDDFALWETIEWLRELQFKKLEGQERESRLLDSIFAFINQPDFMPHDVRLEKITSDGITFVDPYKYPVPIENLSDGYRSILSMTLEIIRQMTYAYPTEKIFSDDNKTIIPPGVVLIDEVDAHLHPTWQKRVGQWFCTHFPNLQFIVTTHSPIVCQAATKGSVWKLPAPNSDESFHRVEGIELNRLLYGNILEAYSTQLFGLTDTQSAMGKAMLEELAQLNIKALWGDGLTDKERQRQSELRAMLPTEAYTVERD